MTDLASSDLPGEAPAARLPRMAGQGRQKRRAVAYLPTERGDDREAVLACARDAGLRILGWHGGEDSRTEKLGRRTGLADALAALADGNADALIVESLDALAPQRAEQEAIVSTVWLHGGRLLTCDGGEITRGAVGGALRNVAALVVDLHESVAKARRRSGRQRKAERGEYAGGRPPYGYRVEDGALVEDRPEQAAVQRMRELHEAGASLQAIADALTTEGYRPRRAERWSRQAVLKVLQRQDGQR